MQLPLLMQTLLPWSPKLESRPCLSGSSISPISNQALASQFTNLVTFSLPSGSLQGLPSHNPAPILFFPITLGHRVLKYRVCGAHFTYQK